MMAGTSASLLLHSSSSPSYSSTKLCLFCLGAADYVPEKNGATDWNMKTYFAQFLWKYLIGDDTVKISEFTGKHLRNTVPPLCSSCHEKCLQLATYHLEFEKIQEGIMEVSRDLLEGWKTRDTLLTKKEYETAVQNASRGKSRPKVPTNRFIKLSPTSGSSFQTAFPNFDSVQMYQILRNPGHVRIPLSCLKSFGFTELKNLPVKNSITGKLFPMPKLPSPPARNSFTMKAVAVAQAAATNASVKAPGHTAKKYWINDVQVEMLNPESNSNDEDDYYEEEEEEYEEPEPVRQPTNAVNFKNKVSVLPIRMPSNGNAINAKRPKLEIEEIAVEPDAEEYYEDEDEDGNNCIKYLEIVGKNGTKYEREDDVMDDSAEDSQYYYEDDNGDEEYDDLEGYEVDYSNATKDSSRYYNGRPNIDLEVVDGQNEKKRKRVFVIRKGNWTQEEDQMISQIVTQEGPKNWSKVALQLGTGRTGKQIRERWTHHLNPEVNKEPWSDVEDVILMQAHAQWGNQWSRISKLLPGRTDNAVKNHWNGTLKRKAQMMHLQTGNNMMIGDDNGVEEGLDDDEYQDQKDIVVEEV